MGYISLAISAQLFSEPSMRTLLALSALLILTACAQIQTVAHRAERMPAGSAITVHMLGAEGAGLEHAVIRTLTDGGFDVRSQGALSVVVKSETAEGKAGERVLRYDTPYVCRIKAMGWGATISSFTLQVIHVPTGRVLISQAGQDGSWSANQVAEALRAQLK